MFYEYETQTHLIKRPQVTSYDSGHEHSVEHWIEVCLLVEEADREMMAAPRMAVIKVEAQEELFELAAV